MLVVGCQMIVGVWFSSSGCLFSWIHPASFACLRSGKPLPSAPIAALLMSPEARHSRVSFKSGGEHVEQLHSDLAVLHPQLTVITTQSGRAEVSRLTDKSRAPESNRASDSPSGKVAGLSSLPSPYVGGTAFFRIRNPDLETRSATSVTEGLHQLQVPCI